MNDPFNPYSDFSDETATHEAFAALNGLVDQVQAKEKEAEDLARRLAALQEELRDLNTRLIPEKMEGLGLEEFKTKGGFKVSVKEEIYAGIKEADRDSAHRWLDEHGHAGILKRDVTVSFNKDQQDAATALLTELGGKFAGVSEKKAVHPSTLKAWVKEMLGAGSDFPLELFGVHRARVAKFARAK